jgi:molybdenum cofactor cytidylyltransferase
MPEPFQCGLILLAAGESRRMGRPKQLLLIEGRPLVRHMTEIVLRAPVAPVVVVLGARAGEIAPHLDDLPVTVVVNPGWAEGLGSSLRTGAAAIGESDQALQGLIVALADQPGLTAGHLEALIEVHRRTGNPIVATCCGGQLMPPLLLAASEFGRLAQVQGDQGLRSALQGAGAEVASVTNERLFDLDTPEDFEAFRG